MKLRFEETSKTRSPSRNLRWPVIINCVKKLNLIWLHPLHLLLPEVLALVQEQQLSSPRSSCPFQSLLTRTTSLKSFGKRVSILESTAG